MNPRAAHVIGKQTRTLLQCLISFVSRFTATSATPDISSTKLRGSGGEVKQKGGFGEKMQKALAGS